MRLSRVHRTFQVAGLLPLLSIGLRTFALESGPRRPEAVSPLVLALTLVCLLLFGSVFWWLTGRVRSGKRAGWRAVVLGLQTIVGFLLHTDLLFLVSAEIPFVLRPRLAGVWMAAQLLATSALAYFLASRDAIVIEPGLGHFSPEVQIAGTLLSVFTWHAFAFGAGFLVAAERREREELVRLNGVLDATRGLLEASSRLSERVQISRDLHDTLGHHLTVLNVNLELAKHLVAGKGGAQIAEAQAVTKLLLSDVREVVSRLREEEALDLRGALSTLALSTAEPRVVLTAEEELEVPEPAKAHALFRCAQEAITNAVRHSGAGRLRLDLEAEGGGIALRVRDDGRGAEPIRPGNGLRGLRERLEEVGGTLVLSSGAGRGFELTAWVPGPKGAA